MNFARSSIKASGSCDRHAVIDVGTNSVKLLVADVGHTLTPVCKSSRQTRLGEGSFCTGRLQAEPIARTVTALAELAAKAREFRAGTLRVLGTSATRDAVNRDEFVQAVAQATGLTVEVISGHEEAEYIFRGVTSTPQIGLRPVLIVDVGGGSTEWVVGEGGFICFTQSTSLGTARLLELLAPGDPPTPRDLASCRQVVADVLISEVQPRLHPVLAAFCERPVCLVGLGGACKALARLASETQPQDVNPSRLQLDPLRVQVDRLWRLSTRERQNLVGVSPEKAGVILAGAVIYESIMTQFDLPELFRSSNGLRTGALLSQPTQSAKSHLPASEKIRASAPPDAWPALRASASAELGVV